MAFDAAGAVAWSRAREFGPPRRERGSRPPTCPALAAHGVDLAPIPHSGHWPMYATPSRCGTASPRSTPADPRGATRAAAPARRHPRGGTRERFTVPTHLAALITTVALLAMLPAPSPQLGGSRDRRGQLGRYLPLSNLSGVLDGVRACDRYSQHLGAADRGYHCRSCSPSTGWPPTSAAAATGGCPPVGCPASSPPTAPWTDS